MNLTDEEKKELLEDADSLERRIDFRRVHDFKPSQKEYEDWVMVCHAEWNLKPSRRIIEYKDVRL